MIRTLAIASAVMLTACHQGAEDGTVPGTSPQGFTGIAPDEIITFTGTEPFWGGNIAGDKLTYSTPEDIGGTVIQVERFTGQGGLGFAGTLDGKEFDMLITPGECSDGMSDRIYPYVATLKLGDELREGCAHTDKQTFSGPEKP
ncbi:hypothetical protein LY632_04890 [Erythrobacter sp. SDW2]|uniref:COG3650 family protein n=1 Tax=Erythrobacter sp. SDW2 TaxID=2907154 RepID=UPI001F1FF4D1|nr:hypothetical protein [Erythrobacter sp. SDW2]UIP07738.1 hypothetical protein LY632_04890 [Erythrobacter sp. SDW2]